MADLYIDPDAVAAEATTVAAAGSGRSTPLSGAVSPAATDPVSVATAQTLTARMAAIGAHSAAATAITDVRAAMLHTSADTYAHQEDTNRQSLTLDGAAAPTTPETPRCQPFRRH